MYDIKYSKPTERYFRKIKDKNLLKEFKDAIDKIRNNPYIGEQKSGDLKGIYGYDVKYVGVNSVTPKEISTI